MRLTLRTLLAYLDGNLEPDDSQDIGKKIEESEFASKLVHLIRDCTRRLRLGAPPVLGRGLGTDPNTVAEYLEYRLADDRVPEFERICLESEIHLAEVASCHQILTLVLGEPAEIDAEMRQRLYQVATRADEPLAATPAINTAAALPVSPAATPPPVVRRPKLEVPEYLRESRLRFWPVAALVIIAATLTLAGLMLLGPAELRDPLTALVQAPVDDSQPKEAANEPTGPGHPKSKEPTDPEMQPTDPAEPSPKVAPENPAGDNPDAPPTPEPTEPIPTEPIPNEPIPNEPMPDAAKPLEPMPLEPEPSDPGAPLPPVPGEKAATAPANPPLPGSDAGVPAEMPAKPGDGDAPAATLPGALPPGEAPPVPGDAPVAREPAEGFGRISKLALLLEFDPASGNWSRLKPMSPVEKGDRLLSLPLSGPAITLSSNFTLQADGAAMFELEGWDADGVPIVSIHYGRLLMMTIGKAGNPLKLKVDGHETLVTFVDAESSLAIEVRRDLPPGQDPEAGPVPLVANVYATDGLIRLRRDDEPPIEFQAPGVRKLVSSAVDPPGGNQFPTWVSQEAKNLPGTSDLDAYLTPDKLTGLQLRELTDEQHKLGKKRDVRSLAARCLAHMGDFEPSLAALNDDDLHNFWPTITDELQAALARSPATAANVRAMLVKQRGEQDGAALYRMLWGYSAADLTGGADRDLVQALDRIDALDFRVLGILNLEQITGATHGYHPEDSEIKRRPAYNTWKQKIGKIVPRSATPPTKSRPPAAKKSKAKAA